MENHGRSVAGEWWVYAIPLCNGRARYLPDNPCIGNSWALYIATVLVVGTVYVVITRWLSPGGCAWLEKKKDGKVEVPGPRGWPIIGSLVEMSGGHAHRKLTELARRYAAKKLMALSLGSTPVVITSDTNIARELLNSPHFADRPLKQSAQELMFGRAIGFASSGEYWRMLRRISAVYLFSPRRIAAHEPGRQADCLRMLGEISDDYAAKGAVTLRGHLQAAALNNIMGSVFGRRFDVRDDSAELKNLREMVEEGFELLGAFNWADHLPWLRPLDPLRIHRRCARLVPRVRAFVKDIIDQHRRGKVAMDAADSDFVDALLSLQGNDKIEDEDMIAVLWEMIFRGTDTIALVIEWTMAELVLKQGIQAKAQAELDEVVGHHENVRDEDIARLPYLRAVVKESLRMHPPGPLLSWARLCTEDVDLGKGMHVPAGTTAMVNMWSITHDPEIWEAPYEFRPERFLECNIDVRGNELKLAPFGAGRRVCPGKGLALSTINLWVAKLLHHYKWLPCPEHPVDLTDILKLSCQMATPLTAVPITRIPFQPERL